MEYELFQAIEEGDQEDVIRLLDADPTLLEREDRLGDRPLALAAKDGHLGIVRMLIQRGAEVTSIGRLGMTALHHAAERGHEEIVAFLLSQGAQGNSRGNDGRTPLLCASQWGHVGVVKVLLQHMGGQGLADRDDARWTALHHAAGRGHEELVAFLLKEGMEANSRATNGATPLMGASEWGRLAVVKLLVPHVGIQGLEDRNNLGRTAFYLAAWRFCHADVVRYLLLAGADHTVTDNVGGLLRANNGGAERGRRIISIIKVSDQFL